MLEVIVGLVAGVVTALGMGGGTILILLINFVYKNYTQQMIQGINLIFFIPIAVVALVNDYKNNLINLNELKLSIVFGVIGVILGSFLSFKIESDNLKKYFGIFLLIIALMEIISLIKKYVFSKKENTNNKS